ncbi:uncharacterized protein N0V89_009708 [Didymosphaeria variabile]|uniref:Uncharacterized protein n=1 Tax=Didymosphaeria variabile TaxID=1932322 RepID=A0A9W8XEV4_9PLEO|nr:uncharacterized protein N0V89_009708 [Didymosphaeria variabile]KAJ4348334.1 hypothetical protein N0V89_009708 [Didymosphaeria variabile]
MPPRRSGRNAAKPEGFFKELALQKRAEEAEEVAEQAPALKAPKRKTASKPKKSPPATKSGRVKKTKKKAAPKKPAAAPAATNPKSSSKTPSKKGASRDPRLQLDSTMKEPIPVYVPDDFEGDEKTPSPPSHRKIKIKNAKVSASSYT